MIPSEGRRASSREGEASRGSERQTQPPEGEGGDKGKSPRPQPRERINKYQTTAPNKGRGRSRQYDRTQWEPEQVDTKCGGQARKTTPGHHRPGEGDKTQSEISNSNGRSKSKENQIPDHHPPRLRRAGSGTKTKQGRGETHRSRRGQSAERLTASFSIV